MTSSTAEVELPAKSLPWVMWAWFGALLLASYAPVLWRLVRQWDSDPDMGHGFFVPLVVAFIAWQKRPELMALKPAPNWWGLALVLYAGFQLCIATLGAELFLARTAFVISVIGIVLLLGGTAWVRALAFPLFLLFFMIPIPTVVYNHITFPLQLLASRVSTQALDLMQIPVLREGNVLELAEQKLSVVEACSGIRSLLSLTFLSLVYGYFFERKVWMRVLLFVSTIPIAIVANASRVTLTGVLTEYKPELAEGFFHTLSGWVIFMVALAILIVLHQILNRAYLLAGRGKRPGTGSEKNFPSHDRQGVVPRGLFPPPKGIFVNWMRNKYVGMLTLALVVQATFFYAASRGERVPGGPPLDLFPAQLGSWRETQNFPIEQEIRDQLKADDMLNRLYQNPASDDAAGLFVAYFKTQRTGQSPHSPKNCLPGAGWQPDAEGFMDVAVAGQPDPIRINRFVVSHGDETSVVLYWYQSQRRVIASEYSAKFWLVLDSIRYHRSDTALVRVTIPVLHHDPEAATRLGVSFVQTVFPILKSYLPA